MEQKIVNPQTCGLDSKPVGMCLLAVRGLRASMRASTNLLKAIAAERAKTMHSIIPKRCVHWNGVTFHQANIAENKAKGSANRVWLNLIMLRYKFSLCHMDWT